MLGAPIPTLPNQGPAYIIIIPTIKASQLNSGIAGNFDVVWLSVL